MDGVGIYTWADGRKYTGEYKDDKKHGYGEYSWADGRVYSGCWAKGKQHGLGIYQVKDSEKKYGLWEEGKRIEWFDQGQVKQILQGELNYQDMYRRSDSDEMGSTRVFGEP